MHATIVLAFDGATPTEDNTHGQLEQLPAMTTLLVYRIQLQLIVITAWLVQSVRVAAAAKAVGSGAQHARRNPS